MPNAKFTSPWIIQMTLPSGALRSDSFEYGTTLALVAMESSGVKKALTILDQAKGEPDTVVKVSNLLSLMYSVKNLKGIL